MANEPTITGSGKTILDAFGSSSDLFSVTSADTNGGGPNQQFTEVRLTITNSMPTDEVSIGAQKIALVAGTSGSFSFITGTHPNSDTNSISWSVATVDGNIVLRFYNLTDDEYIGNESREFMRVFLDSLAYKVKDTTDVQAPRTIDVSYVADSGSNPNSSNPDLTSTIVKNHAPTAGEAQSFPVLEDGKIDGATDAQYKIVGSDVDGDKLTYTLKQGAANGTVVLNADGTFSYEPSDDYFGPDSFTVVITDKYGATAEKVISLTVDPVNDAPTLTATDYTTTFTEGGAPVTLFSDAKIDTIETGQAISEIVVTVAGVKDGDDESLTVGTTKIALVETTEPVALPDTDVTYTVDVDVNGLVTITFTSAGGITPEDLKTAIEAGTYANDSLDPTEGDRTIALTSISDTGGGDDTSALKDIETIVSVKGVNTLPRFEFVQKEYTVNEETFGAEIGNLVVTDPDSDVVNVTFFVNTQTDPTGEPIWTESNLFEIVGGKLKLKDGVKLDFETQSSYEVRIVADDTPAAPPSPPEIGQAQSAPPTPEVALEITINVNDVSEGGGGGGSTNAAPTLILANADATVQAGSALNLTVGDTHFTDPEGADLNFSITVEGGALPSWMTFNTATGALTANPTTGEVGAFTVVVTASDGSLTASDEFEIIVTAPAAGLDLKGTRDDDDLVGGAGDDTINGKKGDDTMTGGDGADTFVFSAGHDKVLDFDAAEGDLIDLGNAKGIKDFEDLMANHIKDTDAGLKIIAKDGSWMFIKGLDADDLTADMFVF